MSEVEYQAMMEEIAGLMKKDAKANTPDGLRLKELAMAAQAYEREHYPRGPVDPITAIRFRMEQAGLKPADLVPYVGSRGRVSEILSGKRPLTLRMVRNLHYGLGIPAESLIGAPESESVRKARRKPGKAAVA